MNSDSGTDPPLSPSDAQRIARELRTLGNTRTATYFFLACAPLVPFTIQLISPVSAVVMFGTFIFFAVLSAYCSFTALRTPCPRCRKRFFVSDNDVHNLFRSRCAHCRLPLHADL